MDNTVIEFIPALGDAGAETLVKDYCVLSKRYGIGTAIPVVIWGDTYGANTKQLQDNNINIIAIFKKRNIFTIGFKLVAGKIYIPWRLSRIAKKNNANVIHFHLGILKYARYLPIFDNKIYCFYTCHNIVKHYFPSKKSADYKTAKILLKKNKLSLIALHDDMKRELDELFHIQSTIVIKNGINFDKFINNSKSREDIRALLNIGLDDFVIGHIGRFSKQKNHAFIIDIFRKAYSINNGLFLLLVGDGELENEIRLKIKEYEIEDRVLILSHRQDVNDLMKAMNVFFFPSLFEGLGIVLIEAQVSGLKCVVSDVVPNEVCITDLVHFHSLDESVDKWVSDLLISQDKYVKYPKYSEYDMREVLETLFKYYSAHNIH